MENNTLIITTTSTVKNFEYTGTNYTFKGSATIDDEDSDNASYTITAYVYDIDSGIYIGTITKSTVSTSVSVDLESYMDKLSDISNEYNALLIALGVKSDTDE
jgi:hypothetical protein